MIVKGEFSLELVWETESEIESIRPPHRNCHTFLLE
jgi:hypothetical protein